MRAREARSSLQPGAASGVQALVLEREAGGGRQLGHERGVVEQAGPVHDGKDVLAAGAHAGRLAPAGGAGARPRDLGVDPLAAFEAVQQLERRVAERVGEPLAQLAGRGGCADVEDEARQRRACAPGAQPRERDAGGDEREGTRFREPQRAVGLVVGEEAAVEAVDGIDSEQRHGGDRRERARVLPRAAAPATSARAGRVASTANAAVQVAVEREPGATEVVNQACVAGHEQQVGRALHAALRVRVEDGRGREAEHADAADERRLPRRMAAGRPSGRSSSPRSAAAASSGGQAA